MSLSIKSGDYGARLGPVPGVVMIFIVIHDLSIEKGLKVEVTSGREGPHMEGSFHFIDLAFDFKFYSVSATSLNAYAKLLKERLGDDYDVVATTSKSIIHIEYQPKKSLGKLG